MRAVLKGFIRNGRVEVDEPIDLPDGTEVVLTPGTVGNDDGPASPEEIARVLEAMRRPRSLNVPDARAADLDARERTVNRRGFDPADSGIEDVFQ